MKILHVITSLRVGGAESLLTDLVPRMLQHGHQVDVLVFDGERTVLWDRMEERGVKIFSLGIGRNVYDFRHIFQLVPYLKKYDVIHTHNTACQFFVALARKISGASCYLVTTEHSTDNRRRHCKIYRPLDRWMYRQYDEIIGISDIATQLLQFYLSNSRVRTIPNGIDVTRFLYAEALPREESSVTATILIMVAGFRVGKQQEVLIKALTNLPNSYKLWLVGDGVRRGECEELSKQLGVDDRVKFWGVRNDVPSLLKAADIVVMSTHYEGMSLSNIEGMGCGRPFVASDVKGIREITQGAGILFPEGDSQALANEVRHLMDNSVYREQVVQRCMDRAKQYDIEHTVKGYLGVYDQLLNKTR